MKKIFKYFGAFLSVVLMGAAVACNPVEELESADLGLGIKVFFPTKVVAGQPMTINGSGFSDATAVVFPDGVTVTDFEIVSNEMIRVTAPAGISSNGGNLIVRTSTEEAESRLPLTLGSTKISGYSKQAGETVSGGELFTIYGTDLEFISSVELLDADGEPLILQDEDFYRKGTSSVVIIIPKKNIYDGSFVGKIYTFDGKVFDMEEYTYEPSSEGGHWETVKTSIWKNEGAGAVSWNGTYRFGLEGHDGNNECIATFPQETWDMIKGGTFYLTLESTDPQIRVTTGWWSTTWTGDDIFAGNDKLTDNGDGTFTLEINFEGDAILDLLDEQHLLFTGDRYTPVELFFQEDKWVDDGGGTVITQVPVWKNEGAGAVSWNGTYRFGLEGHDGNNECIATFPQDVWDRLKSETFYVVLESTDPQIRVTTGWWSTTWTGDDIFAGNDKLTDNGDGTMTLEVNLAGDPILDLLDEQHLLLTGDRYTPIEIYFLEEHAAPSGGTEVVFWENAGAGAVSWNGTYRFGLEGHDGNNECIATFGQDIWDIIKGGTFYAVIESSDPQIRVTTGWWSTTWTGDDIFAGNEKLTDNGDGTMTLEINLAGDAILDLLDEQHLLLTGDRYTPVKLYYIQ